MVMIFDWRQKEVACYQVAVILVLPCLAYRPVCKTIADEYVVDFLFLR